jgi:hypothetical protein
MPSISAPPLALSQVGRAAHDAGLAGLLGGNLFGRFALHPSVTEISDARERGKLVNAAWRRYGAINSLSLLAVTAGWVGARHGEAPLGHREPARGRLVGTRAGPAGEDGDQRGRVHDSVAAPGGVDELAALRLVADLGDARVQRQAAEQVAAEQSREADVVSRAADLAQGHGRSWDGSHETTLAARAGSQTTGGDAPRVCFGMSRGAG